MRRTVHALVVAAVVLQGMLDRASGTWPAPARQPPPPHSSRVRGPDLPLRLDCCTRAHPLLLWALRDRGVLAIVQG